MSSATFPTSPSFNDQFIPAPPTFMPEEMTETEYIEKLSSFLGGQYVGLRNLQNSVAGGWLISTLRVLDLDADTITAGTVFTQDLYIGSDGTGQIKLDGTNTQIVVTDETGQSRVEIGDFGASNADWGIRVTDAGGTVRFQSTSTTFIDGALISAGTITGASISGGTITNTNIQASTITNSEINDVNGNKVALGSLPNSAIASLSADKITLSGTLACNSSDTAIDVTSTGVVSFSSGGDIVMNASGSGNMNFIVFRNASSTERGYIFYNENSTWFKLLSGSGIDAYLQSQGSGNTVLQASSSGFIDIGRNGQSSENIRFNGLIDSDVLLDNDSAFDLGSTTVKWLEMFADTYSDIPFRNSFVMTEADRVVPTEHRDDGIYWMKRTTHRDGKNFNWERVAKLDKDGVLHVKGINIITTEWDDPLDTYYDADYDNQGDAFFITEAPQDAEHVKNAKEAMVRRKKTKANYDNMEQLIAENLAEDRALTEWALEEAERRKAAQETRRNRKPNG